jgi:hypothetical protein
MGGGGGMGGGTGGGGVETAQGFPPDVVLNVMGFLPPLSALATGKQVILSTHPLIAHLCFHLERGPDAVASLAAIYEWDQDRHFEMQFPPSNLRRSASAAD